MAFHGSPFESEIVNERIEGEGKYTFPDGNVYIGQFKDGQFHGNGTIFFTNGGRLDAEWTNGIAIKEKYTFNDGLEYSERGWDYCTEQDRRFYSERVDGFVPGEPQLSNDRSPAGHPMIPIMTSDVGYCYFHAADGKLHNFDGDVVRDPKNDEAAWIKSILVEKSSE